MSKEMVETPVSEATPRLQDMTPEALQAYLSGKDEAEPKQTESTQVEQSGTVPETVETKQEPADEERPGHSRYQRRIDKLTAQIKQLEAENAKYKTGTERPRADSQSSEATSKAPKFRDYQNKIGTQYKDWDSAHDAWETARDQFDEQLRRQVVADAIKAEREQQKSVETQAEQQKTIEKNAKKFADRSVDFRKTLKADNYNEMFLEVKDALDDAISENNAYAQISDILVESEVGPELVYYLGQNPKELDALLRMPVSKALRELGRLEVSDKIKAPTPKTHTSTKRIGESVKGGTVSHDAAEDAVAKNDIAAYLKATGTTIRW